MDPTNENQGWDDIVKDKVIQEIQNWGKLFIVQFEIIRLVKMMKSPQPSLR